MSEPELARTSALTVLVLFAVDLKLPVNPVVDVKASVFVLTLSDRAMKLTVGAVIVVPDPLT